MVITSLAPLEEGDIYDAFPDNFYHNLIGRTAAAVSSSYF